MQLNIVLNDVKIELVDNFKFLGININKNLDLNNHLQNIKRNINNKIWIINRIKKNIDPKTRITLIKQLILSHLAAQFCSNLTRLKLIKKQF